MSASSWVQHSSVEKRKRDNDDDDDDSADSDYKRSEPPLNKTLRNATKSKKPEDRFLKKFHAPIRITELEHFEKLRNRSFPVAEFAVDTFPPDRRIFSAMLRHHYLLDDGGFWDEFDALSDELPI